jgi:hypothetical protein
MKVELLFFTLSRTVMRNIQILVAAAMSLGSLSTNLSADSQDVESSCTVSGEEREFLMRLSDENKKAFCDMTEQARMERMRKFVEAKEAGEDMTPDQAMDEMAQNQP